MFYIVAEVAERRAANANMNKAKLSPTPKNAPLNRFRDSKGTGRVDNTSLRTNAAGTDDCLMKWFCLTVFRVSNEKPRTMYQHAHL